MRMLAFLFFVSCGGHFVEARTTLATAARALKQVDRQVAEKYDDAAREALYESSTQSEYDIKMEPWNQTQESLEVAQAALFATEASLDIAEKRGTNAAMDAEIRRLGCSFLVLAEHSARIGIRLPAEFDSVKGLCP